MIKEKQPLFKASIINVNSQNTIHSNSLTGNQKLKLVNFNTDRSMSVQADRKAGSKLITVREDVVNDLNSIKKILNEYNIPLCCQSFNISLSQKNLSNFGRVGLEIRLNLNSGMSKVSKLLDDDYFIGPDYNKQLGDVYKPKVYGYIRRNPYNIDDDRKINIPLDIYDIRETYFSQPPKIKKIFKPVIDITKLFEEHGFTQATPEQEFYFNSDNEKSHWNVFYKIPKIPIGYSYKELLSTVYDKNNDPVWYEPELFWNGVMFNGR